MDRLRVAMIGGGDRARQVIYPAVASLPEAEIVAVCDIDAERLRAVSDRYGVSSEHRYGDTQVSFKDMIKTEKPDAVFAIGQPHIFFDIWTWCLRQGINLYIEKPMGLTIHQARSLALLAEENHCITRVSFQRRSTPLVEKLHAECLERGPITYAMCRFYKSMIIPFLEARDHMMDDCVHSIDTLRWMCGGEIVKIESHMRRIGVPNVNFITATFFFDNGATGYLVNSWASGKRTFSVEMHAPGVHAEAEHEIGGTIWADGELEGTYISTQEAAGSDEYHVYTGVQKMAREFLEGCRTQTQPPSHFGDAVKTMEAAEIILAQGLLNGL